MYGGFFTDDPARDYDNFLDSLPRSPICDNCGEMVGEKFWKIDGSVYCSECIRACMRYTDDYMEVLMEEA